MSTYIYNGIALEYFRTTYYEMGVERDPSNTDVLWNVYTVKGRGFITLGALTGIAGIPTDTAAALQAVKNALESPRRGLLYMQGSTTVLSIGANPGFTGANNNQTAALDAKLGPEPLPTIVREVTSGTFAIETGVIVRRVECLQEYDQLGNPCPPNPIVSLRWAQTESFDQNWYSHLATEGTLIVRSDLLQSADNFRSAATPPILADYQRIRSKYALSRDGLRLDFAFEDQEVDRLPPFPATKASGRYTVLCPSPGVSRIGNVWIRLEGQKGTSRRDLLVKAFNMGFAKLKADNLSTPNTPILWGTFTEDLFSPAVEVSMQARLKPIGRSGGFGSGDTDKAIAGVLQAAIQAGKRPRTPQPQVMPSVGLDTFGLASNKEGIAPPVRSRIAALLTAAFEDPCACQISDATFALSAVPFGLDPTNPQSTPAKGNPGMIGELRNGGAGTLGSPSISVLLGTTLPAGQVNIDDDAPYDTYEVETSYRWEEGKAIMPGTGVGPDGSVGQVVQFHGGLMLIEVCWVAGRTGSAPVLPAYQSQDPNLVQLGGTIVAKDVQMSADGTIPTYLVAGFYYYGALDPRRVSITAPVPPFLSTQTAQQVAPLAAAAYSTEPLFSFVGQSGPNPFTNTVPLNVEPNSTWASQAEGAVSQGLAMVEAQNPTTSSSAAGQPYGQLGGLGGNAGGGGLVIGAGAPVYA